jgi:hypothetical protein
MPSFDPTNPRDYLKDGPLDAQGNVRERLNGELSLGVAYRLREEGVSPEQLKTLVDRLFQIEQSHKPDQALPSGRVSPQAASELTAAWADAPGGVLEELGEAALPWLTSDWRTFAATAQHVLRILKQLALLTAAAGP